jgi:hypothetical protein
MISTKQGAPKINQNKKKFENSAILSTMKILIALRNL